MSRYMLKSLNPRHIVVIGWDPPLCNFFLQVHDLDISEDEADPVILWLGAGQPATEPEVDPVLREASKWALVPGYVRHLLLLDEQVQGKRW